MSSLIDSPPFVYGLPSEKIDPTWSVTSADSEFPASYVPDFSDAIRPFPGMSTATTDDFIGDFGSATRVDWVLIEHNLDASLSGVQLQLNASNSWSGPTISVNLVIPAKRKNRYTRLIFVDLTIQGGYTTSGLRYIRLHVPNANSVPIGFKILCFSHKRQPNRNVKFGYRPQRHNMGTELTTGWGNTWHFTKGSAPMALITTVDLNDSSMSDMVDWFEDADGVVTAIAAIDPLFPLEGYVVRLRSSGSSGLLNANGDVVTTLDPTRNSGGFKNYNPLQITAEEVAIGDPQWE